MSHINNYDGNSEWGKVRDQVLKFILPWMSGIDIGYGGDPLLPSAITIDRPQCKFQVGNYPLHLIGDASKLTWFTANSMDYVCSSHLLEDFKDPYPIVTEWLRVIKPGGLLILNLPDEKRFVEICNRTGQGYNNEHQNLDMSLNWMTHFFNNYFPSVRIIFTYEKENDYTFVIIVQKEFNAY